MLRKLETVEKALWQNAKIVVPADGELVNVIGDLAGITPVPVKAAQPNPTPGQPQQQRGRRRQCRRAPAATRSRPARGCAYAFFLRGFFSLGGRDAAYAAALRTQPRGVAVGDHGRRQRDVLLHRACPAWARRAAPPAAVDLGAVVLGAGAASASPARRRRTCCRR